MPVDRSYDSRNPRSGYDTGQRRGGSTRDSAPRGGMTGGQKLPPRFQRQQQQQQMQHYQSEHKNWRPSNDGFDNGGHEPNGRYDYSGPPTANRKQHNYSGNAPREYNNGNLNHRSTPDMDQRPPANAVANRGTPFDPETSRRSGATPVDKNSDRTSDDQHQGNVNTGRAGPARHPPHRKQKSFDLSSVSSGEIEPLQFHSTGNRTGGGPPKPRHAGTSAYNGGGPKPGSGGRSGEENGLGKPGNARRVMAAYESVFTDIFEADYYPVGSSDEEGESEGGKRQTEYGTSGSRGEQQRRGLANGVGASPGRRGVYASDIFLDGSQSPEPVPFHQRSNAEISNEFYELNLSKPSTSTAMFGGGGPGTVVNGLGPEEYHPNRVGDLGPAGSDSNRLNRLSHPSNLQPARLVTPDGSVPRIAGPGQSVGPDVPHSNISPGVALNPALMGQHAPLHQTGFDGGGGGVDRSHLAPCGGGGLGGTSPGGREKQNQALLSDIRDLAMDRSFDHPTPPQPPFLRQQPDPQHMAPHPDMVYYNPDHQQQQQPYCATPVMQQPPNSNLVYPTTPPYMPAQDVTQQSGAGAQSPEFVQFLERQKQGSTHPQQQHQPQMIQNQQHMGPQSPQVMMSDRSNGAPTHKQQHQPRMIQNQHREPHTPQLMMPSGLA